MLNKKTVFERLVDRFQIFKGKDAVVPDVAFLLKSKGTHLNWPLFHDKNGGRGQSSFYLNLDGVGIVGLPGPLGVLFICVC